MADIHCSFCDTIVEPPDYVCTNCSTDNYYDFLDEDHRDEDISEIIDSIEVE